MANVELFPYSLPALTAGEYQLDVWHAMGPQVPSEQELQAQPANTTKMVISCPTLKLESGAILSSFPSPGEAAATPNRLPFLVFQQETLPWMYSPALIQTIGNVLAHPNHKPSWMALIALKESELSDGTMPAGGLISRFYEDQPLGDIFRIQGTQVAEVERVNPSIGASTDLCDQLEIGSITAAFMLPTLADCGLTAHVRRIQSDEIKGDDDGYVSILLGTRQLEANTAYRVFLISLQERNVSRLKLLTQGNKVTRFVVLHHYPFRTGAALADFRQRLTAVDLQAWGRGSKGSAVAQAGSGVLLNRQTRVGTKTQCLYHGPLVDRIPDSQTLHDPKIRTSDVPVPTVTVQGKAVRDISYPAAFELGRMLALSERTWLSALLDYRRSWQTKRAWDAVGQARVGRQASAGADSVRAKRASASTAPTTAGVLSNLIPVPGMDSVLTGALDTLIGSNRLSAATVSDPTGLRHLVGRSEVPGLDPLTVATEKLGMTSALNASMISSVDSTVLSSLVNATVKNTDAAQALKSESAAPAPAGTEQKRAAPADANEPLFDGNLLLKRSSQAKARGAAGFTPPAPPELLTSWLYDLCLLKRVPFPYLVPDAGLLPPESLRLFYVDSEWIAHLVDGALGAAVSGSLDAEVSEHLVSRVHADLELRLKLSSKADRPTDAVRNEPLIITGLLLRSELVRAFPSALIRGFSKQSQLRVLRRDQLSQDCLLILFYGPLDKLEIHEPAEGLRYGANLNASNATAELLWQDPAGNPAVADTKIVFAQPAIGFVDLARSPDSLFKRLPVQPANAHHVAWALQLDPFVYTMTRSTSSSGNTGGTTPQGGVPTITREYTTKIDPSETVKKALTDSVK